MKDIRPYTAEIRSRGQLTIPKQVRDKGDLYEGETVSIIPLGNSILVTPQKLELDDACREIRKIMRASGVTLEDLLDGLKDERESFFEETYGKKKT